MKEIPVGAGEKAQAKKAAMKNKREGNIFMILRS